MRHATLAFSVTTLLITLAAPGSGSGAAGRPDFSGTWTMDAARSESAHQAVPVASATLVIRTEGSRLTMESTRTEEGQPATFHETLNFKLDGTETTSMGDGGTTVTCKAHWDGPRLVVETVRNVQDSTVTTMYVHTLSPNGRDLIVDKTLTVQHGYMGRSAPTTGRGKDIFVRVSK